jgi:hypothetical protein
MHVMAWGMTPHVGLDRLMLVFLLFVVADQPLCLSELQDACSSMFCLCS